MSPCAPSHLDRPSSWRDISTAPKDGTQVLVWDEGAICMAGFNEDTGFWCDYGNMEPAPTLWMPLPSPPVNSDGA